MGIRVLITGATGMVGEGVLHTCLESREVDAVLVLGRRSCDVSHPKLREILHQNFHDLAAIASELRPYDACFFCLGVSSIGMNEEQYCHLTYDLTMHVAQTLAAQNTDLTFCYVSGTGTDSTEKGRSMWARIKGKTENDLRKLPFRRMIAFRPGYIHPMSGMKHTLSMYRYVSWLYPVLRTVMSRTTCSLDEIGRAMIHCVTKPIDKTILEGRDIAEVAAL